jgi:hypothetical protein
VRARRAWALSGCIRFRMADRSASWFGRSAPGCKGWLRARAVDGAGRRGAGCARPIGRHPGSDRPHRGVRGRCGQVRGTPACRVNGSWCCRCNGRR